MKRRRRKRSSTKKKKWQFVMLLTAIPSVFIGLLMLTHPRLRELDELSMTGALYLLGGLAVITGYVLRIGCQELHEQTTSSRDSRRGAALITVLVLTATLAAITLHAQALTSARLQLANTRSEHALLTDSATDLAFHALNRLSQMSPKTLLSLDEDTALLTYEDPESGVNGEVHVSSGENEKSDSADSEPLAPSRETAGKAPALGRIYTLLITVHSGHRHRTVLCTADRENSGALSVRRWVEKR